MKIIAMLYALGLFCWFIDAVVIEPVSLAQKEINKVDIDTSNHQLKKIPQNKHSNIDALSNNSSAETLSDTSTFSIELVERYDGQLVILDRTPLIFDQQEQDGNREALLEIISSFSTVSGHVISDLNVLYSTQCKDVSSAEHIVSFLDKSTAYPFMMATASITGGTNSKAYLSGLRNLKVDCEKINNGLPGHRCFKDGYAFPIGHVLYEQQVGRVLMKECQYEQNVDKPNSGKFHYL